MPLTPSLPPLAPIRTTLFPRDTLTFHLDPHNADNTLPQARTDIVVRDAHLTLLAMQQNFQSLNPAEQRNFLVALVVEKL